MNPEPTVLIKKRDTPPTHLQRGSGGFNYTLAHGVYNEIKGVRTTVDVKNLGNESGRSCWCDMIFSNGLWIQIGYRNNGVPVLEYYWGDITEIVIVNGSVPIYKGKKNDFYIRNIGGTYWEAGRNGQTILTFNGGAEYGWNAETGIEFYSSNAKFPQLNFYPALEVWDNGQWVSPASAYVSYSGKWGIEGQVQTASLKKNELNMAGSTSLPVGFTWLWQ